MCSRGQKERLLLFLQPLIRDVYVGPYDYPEVIFLREVKLLLV